MPTTKRARRNALHFWRTKEYVAISNKLIADSFYLQASMRPKVKSPVKHVSLAFSLQDISRFPDNEEGDALMVEIAKKWMEQMGIRNTHI